MAKGSTNNGGEDEVCLDSLMSEQGCVKAPSNAHVVSHEDKHEEE